MNIRTFFEQAENEYLADVGRTYFFDPFLERLMRGIPLLGIRALESMDTELTAQTALHLYLDSIQVLSLMGMEYCHTGEVDEPIWGQVTEIAKSLREVLIKEFQLELPEARVASFVEEMLEDGLLEEVQLEHGERGVRLAITRYQLQIKITKIPGGSAPESVRRSWLGVILPARKESPHAIHNAIASLEPLMGGNGWIVPVKEALDVLSQVDPAASAWFVEHCRASIEFRFAPDEAEVV